MKKIVLSLAFVLMGTFAFANNGELKEESTITVSKENTVKTVDFATFKTMIDNKEIKIVKRFNFVFYDSCGGVWQVSGGDGWTTGEIIDALLFFDSIVCP